MHSSAHDVVIVGARAAGLATAMLLARNGLDVVVLERRRGRGRTSLTPVLMRSAVVQLHRWGLLRAVIDARTPPVRNVTYSWAGTDVPITIRPSHGVDALYAPDAGVLERILAGAARAAGARVERGVSVTGLLRSPADRVCGVVAHDRAGRSVRRTGRWTVGADGPHSTVARLVAAPVERRGTAATVQVHGRWPEAPTDGYRWLFRPGTCVGLIPTTGWRYHLLVATSPDRLAAGGAHALHRLLHEASPAAAAGMAATAPDQLRAVHGPPGQMRVPGGPGWALVGAAGSWTDPIGAQGLTDDLRDAELLAQAILAAHRSEAFEADALVTYHHLRNRLALPMFEVIDAMAAMAWNDDDIHELVLRLHSAAADQVDSIARLAPPPLLPDNQQHKETLP